MPLDQATRTLQDTAALWSIDAVSPQAVVSCACDALIAGLDSPSLRILAGLTHAEADYHVLDILPTALAELGLDFYPRDSRGGQEAAARALAAQAVSGSLTPRELPPRSTSTSGTTCCRSPSAWQSWTTRTTSASTPAPTPP